MDRLDPVVNVSQAIRDRSRCRSRHDELGLLRLVSRRLRPPRRMGVCPKVMVTNVRIQCKCVVRHHNKVVGSMLPAAHSRGHLSHGPAFISTKSSAIYSASTNALSPSWPRYDLRGPPKSIGRFRPASSLFGPASRLLIVDGLWHGPLAWNSFPFRLFRASVAVICCLLSALF